MEHADEETSSAAHEMVACRGDFGCVGVARIDGLVGGHRLSVAGVFIRRVIYRRVGAVIVLRLPCGGNRRTAGRLWKCHIKGHLADWIFGFGSAFSLFLVLSGFLLA